MVSTWVKKGHNRHFYGLIFIVRIDRQICFVIIRFDLLNASTINKIN